jgi:hypothetical protein
MNHNREDRKIVEEKVIFKEGVWMGDIIRKPGGG